MELNEYGGEQAGKHGRRDIRRFFQLMPRLIGRAASDRAGLFD